MGKKSKNEVLLGRPAIFLPKKGIGGIRGVSKGEQPFSYVKGDVLGKRGRRRPGHKVYDKLKGEPNIIGGGRG